MEWQAKSADLNIVLLINYESFYFTAKMQTIQTNSNNMGLHNNMVNMQNRRNYVRRRRKESVHCRKPIRRSPYPTCWRRKAKRRWKDPAIAAVVTVIIVTAVVLATPTRRRLVLQSQLWNRQPKWNPVVGSVRKSKYPLTMAFPLLARNRNRCVSAHPLGWNSPIHPWR